MMDVDDVWCRTLCGIPGGAATDQERRVDEAADYVRRLPVEVSGDSERRPSTKGRTAATYAT